MTIDNLEMALNYAKLGFKIFPVYNITTNGECSCGKPECKDAGKHPRTPRGHLDATNDQKVIKKWWEEHPDSNIGVNCKQSGIIAIDTDNHEGKANGVTAFEVLQDENEKIPDTPTSITGGGGKHILFKAPNCELRGQLQEGIDIKYNGYIILPPSNHESGEEYEWYHDQSPFDIPIAECPPWLLDMIKVKNHDTQISAKNELGNFSHDNSQYITEKIADKCNFIQHCIKDSYTLSEDHWYYGLIGALCRTSNGAEMIHKYSENYPSYSYEETEKKIQHYLESANGSTKCKTIHDKCGKHYCIDCKFNGFIESPVVLGTNVIDITNSWENIDFPLDSLPKIIRDYIEEAHRITKAPVDFWAGTILSVVSGLMGNPCSIRINSVWAESPSLYCVLVGDSGTKKSVPIKIMLKLLYRLDLKYAEEYKEQKRQYNKDITEYNQVSDCDDKECDELDKPDLPKRKLFFTQDTTIESLIEIQKNNPTGVLIISDELTQLIRSFNQYKGGRGSDRSYILQAWNGAPYIQTRKNDEPTVIPHLFHSIAGGIQPAVIDELKDRSKVSDGFTERLLFVYPDYVSDGRITRTSEEMVYEEKLYDLFEKIFNECRSGDQSEISMSEDALNLFEEYSIKLTEIINHDPQYTLMRSYMEKQKSYTARLALIIHYIKAISNEEISHDITRSTMLQAINMSKYFVKQAQKVYYTMQQSHEVRILNKILDHITRKDISVVTPRNIQTARIVEKADEAKALMARLAEYGYGIWNERKGRFIPF
ncbi:MAG: hypothetical protein A2287_08370 [Candidatus Melainabacteria bacterium RIFOXYA12_FULL_32_12]|nr:MAG: hypothetical protein A2287_08370 [Candidatus Melainabacteria bacterium RIFOXYA12_FULL_32_12]